MLPRILETEVMDTADEARDYDAMDHAGVNRAFVADFLAVLPDPGLVLDVGTGTAQIPIELCKSAPDARVVAIDLAEHMLALGRENVQVAGLKDRIALVLQDAKRLPFDDGYFGAVISNSIVHHIPEAARAIAEMARVTARGGVLFVRDLLRPPDRPTLERLVETHAGDGNTHQKQMFADSLHAALTLDEMRTIIAALGFAPDSVRQTTDRHWTWTTRKN